MTQMLTKLFPNFDVIRSGSPEMPEHWKNVLSVSREERLTEVADIIGLAQSSEVRRRLVGAEDCGVLVARGKRGRSDKRAWRLALLYGENHAMLFSFPAVELIQTSVLLPETYLRVVSSLGACCFDQTSGHMIWPVIIPKVANEIRALSQTSSAKIVFPFYSHGTGDYDCWCNGSFDAVWFLDHETASFSMYSQGGFVEWFEKRFLSNL